MQSLHRVRVSADDVAVASDHGRELLDYVLADLPRALLTALERHLARLEVGADLALDALQGVVDRLRVALEPLGGRLVGVAVEVEGEDAALEVGEDAGDCRRGRRRGSRALRWRSPG